jgi:hypothetical protein
MFELFLFSLTSRELIIPYVSVYNGFHLFFFWRGLIYPLAIVLAEVLDEVIDLHARGAIFL